MRRLARALGLSVLCACRSTSHHEVAPKDDCFEDSSAAFPHAVRADLKACNVAADCAIDHLRVDACGTQLAVGVAASMTTRLRACASRSESRVTSCAPGASRAESGGPAVASGTFQVECVERRCETYFRAGVTAPEMQAGVAREWDQAQREKLQHYFWVDRDAGVVAIPIDRAIDQTLRAEPQM